MLVKVKTETIKMQEQYILIKSFTCFQSHQWFIYLNKLNNNIRITI